MNKVVGKVVVKETSKGISDLLVIIYDCDPKTIPDEITSSNFNLIDLDFWNKIQGTRLGSIITDGNGKFEFEYDDEFAESEKGKEDKKPINLAIFVTTAPESIGKISSSRLLYASYDSHLNAGKIESCLIKIPIKQLANIGMLEELGIPSTTTIPDFDDLMNKVKEIAKKSKQTVTISKKPFSERYKEQQELLAKQKKKVGMLSQGLESQIPIQFANGEQTTSQTAKISYDEEKKKLTLISEEEGAQPIQLVSKEITYIKDSKEIKKGIHYVVDKSKKEISLAIPSIPLKLELPEKGTSDLYNFYIVQKMKEETTVRGIDTDHLKKSTPYDRKVSTPLHSTITSPVFRGAIRRSE